MSVAEVHGAISREAIEILPSADVGDPGSLAALDDYFERVVVVCGVLVFELKKPGRGG